MPENTYGQVLGQQMGTQAASGILGEVMGLMFQGAKNRQQLKQTRRLQEQQIKGNKEMGEFNLQKQLELWNSTNYGAQIEHMKNAGLNPGLMYGMSGGGGATAAAQGGNVGGQQAGVAQKSGGEGMGIQGAMMKAQIDNMNASTEKMKAEAAKTSGIDTKLGETQVESLSTGITNTKADTELKRMETEIKRIAGSVSRQTINEQMKVWENMVDRGEQEIKQLKLQNNITEQQTGDLIKKLKVEVANEYLKGINIGTSTSKLLSEIQNNEVTRQKLIQDLWIDRSKLSIENAKLRLMQMGFNNEDVELALPMIGGLLNIMKDK